MNFKDDISQDVAGGDYVFSVVLNGGTCTLTFSVEGLAYEPVKGGAFATDDSDVIFFGDCKVKAGLTGAATYVMTRKR